MDVKIKNIIKQFPLLQEVVNREPIFWDNPDYRFSPAFPVNDVGEEIIDEALDRFERFRELIKSVFPKTVKLDGKIVSPIVEIPQMKKELEKLYQSNFKGTLLLKRDDLLPVAGSIKARGGFHEVLAFAEKLAIDNGLLGSVQDNYSALLFENARELFQQYTISVGSTGNLGLSIGMIGSSLGFHVTVHMSADAKEWKKQLLRQNGVKVIEHNSDYTVAVENARKEAANDNRTYFVDDENSTLLFAGYSTAARELRKQLDELGLRVDAAHPLFVYLPCGVGGGPGGLTFGLKREFGEHVHCFFAEPIQSPCMLTGLVTKLHDKVSVEDFSLTNKTEADGLAVGKPSGFVGQLMESLLGGIYTIKDEDLLKLLYILFEHEGIFLEPSALAGMKGPVLLNSSSVFKQVDQAIHIVWATGGSLVPKELREEFLNKGRMI